MPLLRGRYRVIRSIGAGRFGKTYLAIDEDRLNAQCLIKQFAPLGKATLLFEQEARRLFELGQHPQIPSLFAYFEQDKYLYLVQEFIDGQNLLEDLEQQGAFNEQQIREFLSDLLPVLKFIHDRQVIHRDIKPANIIRQQSDGKFVLIDFGAAEQLGETVLVVSGRTIGTLGYTPIEQIQDKKVYPATDLYSLGAACFHLLTGIHPYHLFIKHGYSWVPGWRQHLSSPVGLVLDCVLDKLLREDVDQRYQSANEAIADLMTQSDPIPPTIPITAIQPTAPSPPIIPITTFPFKPQPQTWKCVHTLIADSHLVDFVAFTLDEQTRSFDEIIQVLRLDIKELLKELLHRVTESGTISKYTSAFAISPDGQTLAANVTIIHSEAVNWIQIWSLHPRQSLGSLFRTMTPALIINFNCLAFSPNGQMIAAGSDKFYDWHSKEVKGGIIQIANPRSEELLHTLTGHLGSVLSVAFSPDSQFLVSSSDDETIKVWHLGSGNLLCTLSDRASSFTSVAISSDGQTVASGSIDGTIRIWNLDTKELVSTIFEHLGRVSSVAFSRDGHTFVSGSSDGTIKIWQCQPTQPATVPLTPPVTPTELNAQQTMPTLVGSRYRIIQLLATNAAGGITFLAEDTWMPSNRLYMVKQFPPAQHKPQVYQTQTAVKMLQHEATILQELNQGSDQIRKLYAYFEEAGLLYLVQEWIEGKDLAAMVHQEGTLSESFVKEILVSILPVLDYVHSKRIIHRDVKPANIMLRQRDGKPVLDDFGAATRVNSQGQTDELIIGTLGFMPPEQLRGEPIYSSDLYALGMTAIDLLTGKLPQNLETDSRTHEILWQRQALNVSPSLAAVLNTAIQYHPRDRYATAREMLNALLAL